MRIYCKAEQHEIGGPGTFFLARSQKLLPRLIEEYAGKVQLIYLDPPFGTGDTFQQKDEKEAPGGVPLFRDDMPEAEYLKWMRTILTGCRDLLSPSGSLYLHIDWRMSAKLRLMLDEIFGQDNFMDEIIWGYKTGGRATRFFPRKHDTILFYRKSRRVYFNIAGKKQTIEVGLDIKNLGNMLNSNWGVYQTLSSNAILKYEGGKYTFTAPTWKPMNGLASTWQMLLNVRYSF